MAAFQPDFLKAPTWIFTMCVFSTSIQYSDKEKIIVLPTSKYAPGFLISSVSMKCVISPRCPTVTKTHRALAGRDFRSSCEYRAATPSSSRASAHGRRLSPRPDSTRPRRTQPFSARKTALQTECLPARIRRSGPFSWECPCLSKQRAAALSTCSLYKRTARLCQPHRKDIFTGAIGADKTSKSLVSIAHMIPHRDYAVPH